MKMNKMIRKRSLLAAFFLWCFLNSYGQFNGDYYDFKTFADSAFVFDSSFTCVAGQESVKRTMDTCRVTFPRDTNGFLAVFRFRLLRADNRQRLFDFTYHDDTLIDDTLISAILVDSTIEFRRYMDVNGTKVFYDYRLYDKLFGLNGVPGSEPNEFEYEIFLYITGSFIWVEVKNPPNRNIRNSSTMYAHSPVHWGLNAGPRRNDAQYAYSAVMNKFLAKSQDCAIVVYKPVIDAACQRQRPYLLLTGIKQSLLLKDLEKYSSNTYADQNNPVVNRTQHTPFPTNEKGGDNTVISESLPADSKKSSIETVHANMFILSPNPTKDGTLTISSRLQKAGMVQVVIIDGNGSELQQLQYNAGAGVINKQITLASSIRKGLYYVKIISGETIEVKKLVADR
jgi:hypothetical protein